MRILITGAGGMLGHDVARATQAAGHQPLPLMRAELNIASQQECNRALAQHKPDVVINCAAYTNVDGAEKDWTGAEAVNATGAGNLAVATAQAGAKLVHISTDYVFDGTKRTPYVESDPTAALGVYGQTKLAGEQAVTAASPQHLIVRTAWLFGTNGPNFVATMLRLAADRDSLDVVTDQVGCPTYTGHLAQALVQLANTDANGIHHCAAQGHCSWNEFAQEIFRQAQVQCTVNPTTTAAMARPAPRPAYSVLGTERTDSVQLPPWQEGLAAYLESK